MDMVETVSLGVWVAVGTRHERPEVNGVAHMLEHMAFKGTKTRTARAIAEEIEAVGGHLNAHTSREFTAFHATVLKADVALAVDIIADILQNSVFDEAELARERVVIAQEIGEAADIPDDVIFDEFQAAAFPGQPIGRPILGEADIIEKMQRGDVIDYMSRHYAAPIMVVAAAGNLDPAKFVATVEKAFTGLLSRAPEDGIVRATHTSCLVSRAFPMPIPISMRSRCCRRCWAAACPRASSRKSAKAVALPTRSIPGQRPTSIRGCSGFMPAPARSSSPNSCLWSATSSIR
jgi:predicted Zn-dependent peptidase